MARGRGNSEGIWLVVALLVVLALAKTGAIASLNRAINGISTPTHQVAGHGLPIETPGARTAIFDKLTIAPEGPMTGYSRAQFGPAWADVNHNGCDTRNDILNRDLTNRTWRSGTHDCVVMTGTLKDPYTGSVIHFTKAQATKVQIDHVVPLGAAWRAGAAKWTAAERLQYANDPLVLLAVDGPSNEAKGDSPPNEWLPPDKSIRCGYVIRYAQISEKYALSVTATDKAKMVAQCPAG